MAKLFSKQAKEYANSRPTYPDKLFEFISSKTPHRNLAWDVATGNGQAALPLAKIYKNVIATDTSQSQLDLAPQLKNVRYKCTPSNISMEELQHNIVTEQSSLDLVTVAAALHWLHLPSFYQQVHWALKKPHGAIAAWMYNFPTITTTIDSILQRIYTVDCEPYWAPEKRLTNDGYKGIDFPFEPVEGCDHTGPFEFKAHKLMDFEEVLALVRSLSAYQTAKEKGVELLGDDVIEDLKRAWNEHDGQMTTPEKKVVTFPIFLRIGKVGSF